MMKVVFKLFIYSGDSMKYYYNMDIIKFFCAIAVVLIHTTGSLPQYELATMTNYYFYRPLLDIAVPFFFAASGFFLSLKPISYYKGYINKILTLYISFTIFYIAFKFLLVFSDRLFLGKPFWTGIENILKNLSLTSLLNGTIGSFHLWFLPALIIAAFLLLVCVHFSVKPSITFLISSILYLANLTEMITFNDVFQYGGFTKGFFYLSMGYYIGHLKPDRIKNPFIGFSLSALLYVILTIYQSSLNVVFLMITTFYLVIASVKKPGEKSLLSRLGSYSLNIYILHIFFYQSINKILIYFGYHEFYKLAYYYVIVTLLCIVLSVIFYEPIFKQCKRIVNQYQVKQCQALPVDQ